MILDRYGCFAIFYFIKSNQNQSISWTPFAEVTYINYSAKLLDHLELKQYIKLFLIRILEITSLIDIELLFYSIQAQ